MPRHSPCALIRLTYPNFKHFVGLKFGVCRFYLLTSIVENPFLVSLQSFKNYAGSISVSFSWNCISITLKFFFLTVAFSLLLLHSMFSFQGTSSSKQTQLIPFPSAPFGSVENAISLCCFSSPIKTRFAGLLFGSGDGWVSFQRLIEIPSWRLQSTFERRCYIPGGKRKAVYPLN